MRRLHIVMIICCAIALVLFALTIMPGATCNKWNVYLPWSCEVSDFSFGFGIVIGDPQLDHAHGIGNVRVCEKITPSKRDSCLRLYAMDGGGEKICNIMTEPVNTANCVDDYRAGIARQNKDYEGCEKVIDPGKEDECKIRIAQGMDDEAVCAGLNDPATCYARFADSKDDPEICMMSDDKDDCIHSQSWNPEDRKWCFEIDDLDMKERCLARTAGAVEDCEGLTPRWHDSCVDNVMYRGEVVEDCLLFNTSNKRWGCIQGYANDALDPEICNLMDVELRAQYCKETVHVLIRRDKGEEVPMPYHQDVNNPDNYE
ncbi:hypothetical protein KY362_06440 [Candidatus Woesearchaeota archaeon]|nr:hypothetical protein [Candidatus Woesearchaeota archaeon]